MAASPPPPESTQPLAHRRYSIDERNDEVSDEDSAPLISPDTPSFAAKEESSSATKATRILTALTLTCSTLAIILLVANKILLDNDRRVNYELYWPTRAGSRAVGITVCSSYSQSHYICLLVPLTVISLGGLLLHHINLQSGLHPLQSICGSSSHQHALRRVSWLFGDRICGSRHFFYRRYALLGK